MRLFRRALSVISVITLLMIGYINCWPNDDLDTGRSTDEKVCAAIDRLHESLRNSSLEEKCKRYVVLIFIVTSDGALYEPTLYNVINLSKKSLNSVYDGIDNSSVSSLLMSAIDKYRIVGLSPAFIDLVECLRSIDTPHAQEYLSDQEVMVIEILYKQVLEAPGRPIDISCINASKFQPALKRTRRFKAAIRDLFKDYIQFDRTESMSADTRTSNDPKDPLNIAGKSCSNPKQVKDLEEERLLLRKRERARLNSRRRRIIHPNMAHENYLKRKERTAERVWAQLGQQVVPRIDKAPVEREEQPKRVPYDRLERQRSMKKMLIDMQAHFQQLPPDLPKSRLQKSQLSIFPFLPTINPNEAIVPSSFAISHLNDPQPSTSRDAFMPTVSDNHLQTGQIVLSRPGNEDSNHQRDPGTIIRDAARSGPSEVHASMSFNYASGEERLSRQRLLNIATQTNDTESFMQYLLDEPEISPTGPASSRPPT